MDRFAAEYQIVPGDVSTVATQTAGRRGEVAGDPDGRIRNSGRAQPGEADTPERTRHGMEFGHCTVYHDCSTALHCVYMQRDWFAI